MVACVFLRGGGEVRGTGIDRVGEGLAEKESFAGGNEESGKLK
jgi:hypothetical protein